MYFTFKLTTKTKNLNDQILRVKILEEKNNPIVTYMVSSTYQHNVRLIT